MVGLASGVGGRARKKAVPRGGAGGAQKTVKKKGKGKYKDVQDPWQELEKKDQLVADLEDTVEILELKVSKLERLVSLKEHKIEILENSLKEMMEG